MTFTFVSRCELPVPADEAFAWHARDGAFERLLPPWEHATLVRRSGGIQDGAETVIDMRIGPLPVRWRAVHFGYDEGRQFCDRQVAGPFAFWEHTHRFLPGGASSCTLEDRIQYQPPLGALGSLLGGRRIERRLERVFAFRHALTKADLADHVQYRDRPRLRIAITGASGLVGSALTHFLTTGGHQVVRLKRGKPSATQPAPAAASSAVTDGYWNVESGELAISGDAPLDAVVHLAGESIAAARWTPAVKQRIRDSRIPATRRLAEHLAHSTSHPAAFISASAIGYYGDRGDEQLDETATPGDGFLPEVCREWEAAADPARQAGIRVVHPRLGMVLSPQGGALAKMLTPFRLGGGGPVGNGQQIWSWLTLDDTIAALHHALMREDLAGPVNFVSPHAVSSKQFARTLGRVLHRPAIMPLPGAAARLALGEMADGLLLASAHVVPRRLLDTGHRFRFADLETALRHLLGR